MRNPVLYREVTGESLEERDKVVHHTQQYVDDSSNVIRTNKFDELRKYIEKYMKLLKTFYFANKL